MSVKRIRCATLGFPRGSKEKIVSENAVAVTVDGCAFGVAPGWSRAGLACHHVRIAGLDALRLERRDGEVTREQWTALLLRQGAQPGKGRCPMTPIRWGSLVTSVHKASRNDGTSDATEQVEGCAR